jgi:hypothetical protein
MGNAFTMLLALGVLLTVLGLTFKRPLLYLFGADDTYYMYSTRISPFISWEPFRHDQPGDEFVYQRQASAERLMTVALGARSISRSIGLYLPA